MNDNQKFALQVLRNTFRVCGYRISKEIVAALVFDDVSFQKLIYIMPAGNVVCMSTHEGLKSPLIDTMEYR